MKSPDSSVKTILVVEDEPSITSVCHRVLTNEGYEVEVAINGKLAQNMIAEKQYSMCLIDMRTPEMNGGELYVWLLQEHPQMARRVIFTTGDVMGGETTRFIEQSGMPFLPKPFTPDELRAVVREALKEVEE
ncbi:response regulator [Chloroflexota bacterium]